MIEASFDLLYSCTQPSLLSFALHFSPFWSSLPFQYLHSSYFAKLYKALVIHLHHISQSPGASSYSIQAIHFFRYSSSSSAEQSFYFKAEEDFMFW